jgi:hypothetical protein
MFYWNPAEITTDEVTAVSAADIADTPSARRIIILELLAAGLLQDRDGRVSDKVRARLLAMIGLEELI